MFSYRSCCHRTCRHVWLCVGANLTLLVVGISSLFILPLLPVTSGIRPLYLPACLFTAGLGISTLHSVGLLFINRRAALTSRATSRLLIAGAVGWMSGPYCSAILLERFGHVVVTCVTLAMALISCCAFGAMVTIECSASFQRPSSDYEISSSFSSSVSSVIHCEDAVIDSKLTRSYSI